MSHSIVTSEVSCATNLCRTTILIRMLFRLTGRCADRVDANGCEVLSVAVNFLVLLAAFLLEDDYFSAPAVLDNRRAHALAFQGRSADSDLIAVRRKKSFEFYR